jgi:CheY-like chemotaxis protein
VLNLQSSRSDPPSSRGRVRPSSATDPDQLAPAVLVVDDDPDTCAALELVLGDAGYPTLAVNSAKEALDLLRASMRPKLILVDLMMPGMDGWSLIPAIRELVVKIPIVSMTAGPQLHTAPVSADYLSKPFQWDRLLRVVERHCGEPQPRKAREEPFKVE